MFGLIGLILQILGIVIVLVSQALLVYRSHKKWGSLKKTFINWNIARLGMKDEELRRMSQVELRELIKKFPLADFLYDDFIVSVFGLIITLFGLLCEVVDMLLFG